MSRNISLKFEKVCFFCEKSFDDAEKTREHIWPRVLGGPNSRPNIVACCYECNNDRSSRLNRVRSGKHTQDDLDYIRDCARLFYYRMWKMFGLCSKRDYLRYNNCIISLNLSPQGREPFNRLSSPAYDDLYGGKDRPVFYAKDT